MQIKNRIIKILSLSLIVSMIFVLSSCSNNEIEETTTKKTTTTVPTTTAYKYAINSLTGVRDLDWDMVNKRPVAIMINNISLAQDVQTAVGDADMVFETLVEGGITRLMAVYSDISKIGQIGTCRSSRYSYAELACGLDARYVHCGSDNKYCTPLMKELGLDNLDLGGNAYSASKRISNGHDYEHTLYTYGDKLAKLYNKGRTEIKDRAKNAYKFNDEKSPKKYEDEATDVSVKFSSSYTTGFEYDKESNKYIRKFDGDVLKDYKTGKSEKFTNVIVLFTDVYALSDGYHMRSKLSSGKGYYITNGTKTSIKWEKGNSSDSLKYFDENGNELILNAGNSYICITDTDNKSAFKAK